MVDGAEEVQIGLFGVCARCWERCIGGGALRTLRAGYMPARDHYIGGSYMVREEREQMLTRGIFR